ncbi:MAG: threonine/serine dehydratase, partial [Gaiellales bacterium]
MPEAAYPTPLERAPDGLSHRGNVYLKREDVHELGSFKWRGSLPTLTAYRDRGATRVVTSSTGNHGAATAWAAEQLGLEAVVFVPETVSRTKLALLEGLGAETRIGGTDLDASKDLARAYAAVERAPFFEDGAEPVQYAGYESIAEEIVAQLGGAPGAVVVPVGNGALLAGVGTRLHHRVPKTSRVGVVAKAAPVMALSLATGHAVECDECETFADGLAVRVALPAAVTTLRTATDELFTVSERSIAVALMHYAEVGIRVEGAAAASLAALDRVASPGPIVLLVTGRNI